jgi:YhcN/YlaJ family sporulation lipoprotein
MIKFRLAFLALLLIAGGCQMANDDLKQNTEKNGQQNNSFSNIDTKESQEISQKLEKIVLEVPNVRNADAVVLGNYTFVAVDVDENVDRSKVGTIKHSVTESLQNDPHGKNAIVVADPDIIARLREVGQDIADGKPIQGIMNELADIAGRIMPEAHNNNQDSPSETNQNENMPAKDQKELNKKQQEQSNK